MKQSYKSFNFRADTLALLQFIDTMIGDYQDQGFKLSVRQIYYQKVATNFAYENV